MLNLKNYFQNKTHPLTESPSAVSCVSDDFTRAEVSKSLVTDRKAISKHYPLRQADLFLK